MLIPLVMGFFSFSHAQKVGVVLSGGGVSGIAHIGFLKALEENGIPIDYIAGTSSGALVGGLYASGYSTDEIEQFIESHDFQVWTSGKIDERYTHYFKKNADDASWIKLKFSLDSLLALNLPTNLINSTSLDFGLAELFAGPNARADQDFDSLFIPFRCVAADISTKKSIPFEDGDLATSIRASMSYPFVLNPIEYQGKLLFDGGLYDNFPVKTLCESFEPDYIIGSNVSYNFPEPDAENLISQVQSMMAAETDYEIDCEKGFIIEPKVTNVGLRDFELKDELVAEGYRAAMEKMDSIKMFVAKLYEKNETAERRAEYRKRLPEIKISKVEIEGVKRSEAQYIRRSMRIKTGDTLEFDKAKAKVMKLASDEKIKKVFPVLTYVPENNGYTMKLYVKKEKEVFLSFGGVISTNVVNEGFVGLQYNILGPVATSIYGNAYFGRFYNSLHGKAKLDIPIFLPFQLHGDYTFNKLDYSLNASILSESSTLTYLVQTENYGQTGITFPISYKGKLEMGANFGEVRYEYYQDNEFTRFDTTDFTTFFNYNVYGKFERNSLNRKQYPNTGGLISLKLKYIMGEEHTELRNSSVNDSMIEADRQWVAVKFKFDRYYNANHKVKFGTLVEGVWSDQPFFSNYANSILAAPSFEPVPESKIIFRSRFRAYQWGAIGLRGIYSPIRNFDIRLEGFMFQPLKQIERNPNNTAYFDESANRYFIGSFTLLYDLNFTQIAVNLNYYDNFGENFPSNNAENYSIMFHLGFIIFNEKMHD